MQHASRLIKAGAGRLDCLHRSRIATDALLVCRVCHQHPATDTYTLARVRPPGQAGSSPSPLRHPDTSSPFSWATLMGATLALDQPGDGKDASPVGPLQLRLTRFAAALRARRPGHRRGNPRLDSSLTNDPDYVSGAAGTSEGRAATQGRPLRHLFRQGVPSDGQPDIPVGRDVHLRHAGCS